MDLIGQLASQLGVEPSAAQAIAGTVLGGARDQVADKVGETEAAQLGEAVPELPEWQGQASALLGGDSGAGGLLGGALGALGSAAGGGDSGGGGLLGGALGTLGGAAGGNDPTVAAVAGLLGKLNLSPSAASTVAPLVLGFLESRLPPELVSKIKSAAPVLGGGGLGSLLGG